MIPFRTPNEAFLWLCELSEVFVGKPYRRQQFLNIENVYFRYFREIVENGLRRDASVRIDR